MDNEKFTVEFGEVTNIGGGGTSDFDELTNRPKYNDTTMSSDTNIPKVPAKTSDLTNDGSDGDSTYVEADELAKVATSGSYADLENKPSIPTVNDATLTITQNGTSKGTFTANDADDATIKVSDTTYSNFTGTDGTTAGAAGLVPAPATTDAGKFLKADGTWDTAGGGGDTVYSDKITSTSDTGGAVYIGNLNSSQQEQADPSTAGSHNKFFWALPNSNSKKPTDNSINILGEISSSGSYAICFGNNASVVGNYGMSIGANASSVQGSLAIGRYASAGNGNTNRSGCISIGENTISGADYSIVLGNAAGGTGKGIWHQNSIASVAIGRNATIGDASNGYKNSVALGAYSKATRQGEVNVGLVMGETTGGYNSTAYRVIGGVHDGQDGHDAVTVNQINALIDAINSATNSSIPHIGS